MADEPGSGRPRRPRRSGASHRRRRLMVALAAVVCAGLGVWALATLNSARTLDGQDWSYVGQGLAMIALVSASLVSRRLRLAQMVRYGLGWAAIVAVLLVGFSYRDELGAVVLRVRSELSPASGVETAPRELVLLRDEDGHFYVMGSVNGAPVRFLVDTGASDVVLSPADARRVGLDPAALDFSQVYETANGVGRGAAFTADSLKVGSITFSDVPMTINQTAMPVSLLGMSFLIRLDSFEVRGRRLYLRWSA